VIVRMSYFKIVVVGRCMRGGFSGKRVKGYGET
jgi:hypothetical protein